jgi:hypothetical protein
MHALRQKPVAQRVQLAGHGAEDRRLVAADRDVHTLAADIDECRLGVQNRQVPLHRSPPRRIGMCALQTRPGHVKGKSKSLQREAKLTKMCD